MRQSSPSPVRWIAQVVGIGGLVAAYALWYQHQVALEAATDAPAPPGRWSVGQVAVLVVAAWLALLGAWRAWRAPRP